MRMHEGVGIADLHGNAMRLNPPRDAIAAATKAAFPAGTCVRLFGSRIDGQRRGGDIDLLVETHSILAPDD